MRAARCFQQPQQSQRRLSRGSTSGTCLPQVSTETDRETDETETETRPDTETVWEQTGRQTQKQTERQTETNRETIGGQTDRQTDRHAFTHCSKAIHKSCEARIRPCNKAFCNYPGPYIASGHCHWLVPLGRIVSSLSGGSPN